jgi:hypothetical protein
MYIASLYNFYSIIMSSQIEEIFDHWAPTPLLIQQHLQSDTTMASTTDETFATMSSSPIEEVFKHQALTLLLVQFALQYHVMPSPEQQVFNTILMHRRS